MHTLSQIVRHWRGRDEERGGGEVQNMMSLWHIPLEFHPGWILARAAMGVVVIGVLGYAVDVLWDKFTK